MAVSGSSRRTTTSRSRPNLGNLFRNQGDPDGVRGERAIGGAGDHRVRSVRRRWCAISSVLVAAARAGGRCRRGGAWCLGSWAAAAADGGDEPDAADTLAGRVTRLGVRGVVVEGPAVIRHLERPIGPGERREGSSYACASAVSYTH